MVNYLHRLTRPVALVAAVLSLALSANAFSMQNVFLELDGIKGESTSAQGLGMIELLSFNHGVSMPITSGPSNTSKASGRCVHQDFTVSMRVGLEWPTLMLKTSGGENIKSAKMHVWKADAAGKPFKYMQVSLDNVLLTSVSYGGGGDQPVLTMTMKYNRITWDYGQALQVTPGAPGGGIKGKNSSMWDVEMNKGG